MALRVVVVHCLVGVTLLHAVAIAVTVIVLGAQLSERRKSHVAAELMMREIGVLPLPMERNVTIARVCLLSWMIWKPSPRHTWLTKQNLPFMMTWIPRILRTRGFMSYLPVRPDVALINRSQELGSRQNFFSVLAAAGKRDINLGKVWQIHPFCFSW